MVSKNLIFRLIVSLLLLTTAQASMALQTLTTSIDRNPVMVNEAFVLTVEADDSVSTNSLDTSPLLQHFIVGRTSSGTAMQMVNGKTTRTTTWTIVLVAQTKGTVEIPAFDIEGIKSRPIQVNVVAASANTSTTKQLDAFLDVEIDNGPFYPQQTFRYQLNFYYATAIQSGQLSDPIVEDALVEQIENDVEGTEIINGKRYKVFTRYYAITPEHPGEFTIAPVQLNGEQLSQPSRRSFYSSLTPTKPVTLLSDAISFTVKTKPEFADSNWLPVELLNLHEEWQPAVEEYQVGEPITRTLTLTALGAKAEQLPELTIEMPEGVKAYPENPALNTMNREGRVIGQRKETLAIIPTQPGRFVFPAVNVTYFNTKTKQQELATIPEKNITVIGGLQTPSTEQIPQKIVPMHTESSVDSAKVSTTDKQQLLIWRALCTFFALAWVITLGLWWITKRSQPSASATESSFNDTEDNSTEVLWQKFSQACVNQQGNIALIALLNWAKQRLPNQHFQSAEDLAKRLQSTALRHAILKGQSALYSADPSQFNWDVLPRLVKAAIDTQREKHVSTTLPPLNPE